MKYLLVIFLFLLSIFSKAQDTTKILFIGNSHTFVGDLPSVFNQLSIQMGKTVFIDSYTMGGATLQMHTESEACINKIYSTNWNYVILQEQSQIPSFIPERETMMYPYATFLDSIIHDNSQCTQTVFFQTWAHKNGDLEILQNGGADTYEEMQQRLRSGYQIIADTLHAMVAPCGWACRSVRLQYPSLELYSSDDYHPGVNMTYLAACAFYSTIFRESTESINLTNNPDYLILQSIASHTVLDSLSSWNIGTYSTLPIASFSAFQSGNFVDFSNNSINASNYTWNFGDNDVSSEQNPSHTYLENGHFIVTLTAENGCGSDIFSSEINIDNVSLCQIPQDIHPIQTMEDKALLTFSSNAPDFIVSYSKMEMQDWTSANFSNDTILVEGLIPNQSYQFKIKAICSPDSSEWSPLSYFTTQTPSLINQPNLESGKFLVFPNPAKKDINILNFQQNTIKQLLLISPFNEVVYQNMDLDNFEFKIDVSNLSNGLYLLIIESMNTRLIQKISIVK